MHRFRIPAMVMAILTALAGASFATGFTPTAFFAGPPEEPAVVDTADEDPDVEEESEEAEEAAEEAEEEAEEAAEEAEEGPEEDAEDAECEDQEAEDEAEDAEGEDEGGEQEAEGIDHHCPGTIVSFDESTGALTVMTPTGEITGLVTADTELEWESSGEGPGECNGSDVASTEDLVPGNQVSEMEFVDAEHLAEVELVCPTAEEGETDDNGIDEGEEHEGDGV